MVSVAYFDTSALLKRYVSEKGSDWINTLLSSPHAPAAFISRLTVIEATCAFARRLREGTLLPVAHAKALLAFDYDITYRYNLVDVMSVTIDAARQLVNKHPLRAYDAVQLATAWLSNRTMLRAGKPPLTFISADDRLLAIAQAEGLLTDNPNHHA
jgi:predicted nucleic acid-binding protein